MKLTDDEHFRPLSAKKAPDDGPGVGNKRKAQTGGAGRKWQAFLQKQEKVRIPGTKVKE